jgi:hypothetical protein
MNNTFMMTLKYLILDSHKFTVLFSVLICRKNMPRKKTGYTVSEDEIFLIVIKNVVTMHVTITELTEGVYSGISCENSER